MQLLERSSAQAPDVKNFFWYYNNNVINSTMKNFILENIF